LSVCTRVFYGAALLALTGCGGPRCVESLQPGGLSRCITGAQSRRPAPRDQAIAGIGWALSQPGIELDAHLDGLIPPLSDYGDTQGGRALLKALGPVPAEPLRRLAARMAQLDRRAVALGLAHAAWAKSPPEQQAASTLTLAQILFNLGKLEATQARIAAQPPTAEVLDLRAALALALHQPEAAQAALTALPTDARSSWQALRRTAAIQQHLGNADAADDAAMTAVIAADAQPGRAGHLLTRLTLIQGLREANHHSVRSALKATNAREILDPDLGAAAAQGWVDLYLWVNLSVAEMSDAKKASVRATGAKLQRSVQASIDEVTRAHGPHWPPLAGLYLRLGHTQAWDYALDAANASFAEAMGRIGGQTTHPVVAEVHAAQADFMAAEGLANRALWHGLRMVQALRLRAAQPNAGAVFASQRGALLRYADRLTRAQRPEDAQRVRALLTKPGAPSPAEADLALRLSAAQAPLLALGVQRDAWIERVQDAAGQGAPLTGRERADLRTFSAKLGPARAAWLAAERGIQAALKPQGSTIRQQ
jgi:hypothetical protein